MDVSRFQDICLRAHLKDLLRKASYKGALTVWSFHCLTSTAHAYNPPTHDQITRSALTYLKTHPTVFAETKKWVPNENNLYSVFMEETLVRAVIDADYRSDLWMTGWFHHPFTGGGSSHYFTIFTSMYHYLNATVTGDFWQNDGYAYRHGSGDDNDAYLDTPSATIVGALSAPLGGKNSAHPVHGIDIGAYKLDFKGSDNDWNELFFGKNSGRETVFPPANVPAQLAFNAMLRSSRSTTHLTESWTEKLPIVTGLTSTTYLSRHYWRGEVANLPKGFDLLGLTLHMAQDVTVPQHAAGTADWCHQDLENLGDQLTCDSTKNIDQTPYRMGYFQNDHPQCQFLYDPNLVEQILSHYDFLNPKQPISVSERIRSLAYESARWRWGDPTNSEDAIGTVLPDGSEFTADFCNDLMQLQKIKDQLKYQYNLAVAASVTLFEMAAHQYESLNQTVELPAILSSPLF